MNPVILILSCERDRTNGRNAAARDTWLFRNGRCVVDYFFVHGHQSKGLRYDEIAVDARDEYTFLAEKQRAAYRSALINGYTHAFVCCVDTWVSMPRLLASGFGEHDYIGRPCNDGYAGGGAGYWLSQRAMDVLAHMPPSEDWPDKSDGYDLRSAGIKLHVDNRYWSTDGPPYLPEDWTDVISVHLSRDTGFYEPRWMHECHQKFLESQS